MSLPERCYGDELAGTAEVPNRTRFVTGMLISHAQHKFYRSTEDSAARPWYVDDQAPCVGVRLLCVLPRMCVRVLPCQTHVRYSHIPLSLSRCLSVSVSVSFRLRSVSVSVLLFKSVSVSVSRRNKEHSRVRLHMSILTDDTMVLATQHVIVD